MNILRKLFGKKPKAKVLALNEENFRRETETSMPVVVDVWSPGCGPCEALAPTIKALAEKFEGKVKVGELNAAENQELVFQLGVMGTPTVLFLHEGVELDRVVGFRGRQFFETIIESLFSDIFGEAEDRASAELVVLPPAARKESLEERQVVK